MEAGRRVFGRFEITGPLPDVGELERHAAVEVETGREVELIRPGALAALRPGARERFRSVWSPPEAAPLPPARLASLAVGELDGRPAAVRPRMHSAPGSALRLDADAARALAGWILPALTVAPPPGGQFGADDLMLDDQGRPWITPAGIVPRPTVTAPPLYTPPDQTESDMDRARYGFGVQLYKAVTGVLPFESTGNQAQLRERQQTPTPIEHVAPDLPRDLQILINRLVHPDPTQRAQAAVPPPIEAPKLPLSERTARPRPTHSPAPRSSTAVRRDTPLAAYAIVLHQRSATDAARRRLAALLDRQAEAFILPRGAPAQTLVETADTAEAAQARLDALAPAGAPLSIVSTATPARARHLVASGLLGAFVAAPTLGLALGTAGALLIALASIAATAVGWRELRAATARRALLRRTGQYTERGPQPASALTDGAQKLGIARRAQTARKAILLADLPEPIRLDLLQSVDDLEDAGSVQSDAVYAALEEIRETARDWSPQAEPPDGALDRARKAIAAARTVRH